MFIVRCSSFRHPPNPLGAPLFAVASRHRDHHLARPLERIARVRAQHVVEHQHVARLPREHDPLAVEHRADLGERVRLERRAVAVIDVARHVLDADRVDERFLHVLVERRQVKEVRLVEPYELARARMARDRLAALAGAQKRLAVVAVAPFAADPARRADALDFARIAGAERLLPRQIEPLPEIAHVQELALGEARDERRIERAIHGAAIGDRRRAARARGERAVEPDPQRPLARVRLLVVQRDRAVRRIFGRRVDRALDLAARRRRELVADQRIAEIGREALEGLDRRDAKAGEKHAARTLEDVVGDLAQQRRGLVKRDVRAVARRHDGGQARLDAQVAERRAGRRGRHRKLSHPEIPLRYERRG
ncbi:hypothetical protein Y030_6079 [Burkholderia pseudomallei MSHR332]|nr:hypothetical protein Y030_6079 [Burkholderia pseudomallei MSHR332]